MEDYMIAIINGNLDDDGNINYLGYLFNYSYHAQCLIDYASKKYPAITGFQNLNYMDDPNSPIYYLSLLNNAIFTNVSVDDEKRGMLYLPKELSEKQIQTLYAFAETILDFDVCIVYDMELIDGVVVGKTFDIAEKLNVKDKLENFIMNKQIIKKVKIKNG